MSLAIGSRLGPYEIQSAIGAGGMGEVYRARDTKLGRDVALKVLPESLARDPERIARMHREAQVLAALNHPNIAAIHGFEDGGAVHALVLEFVDGETLADQIARGPIPIGDALPVAKQIAEALEAAHEQGIIHRDLKPANIKVRPDGTVKVLDFGLAKLSEPTSLSSASPSVLSVSPTITSPALVSGAGVLLGTAAYMSPEQAKGRSADKRSDIWAFGCVLYEMLTGARPFDGEDITDVLVAVLGQEPVRFDLLPTSVPIAIRVLLRRCLEKDRRKRTQDIAAALFVIEEVTALTVPERVAVPATDKVASKVGRWRLAVMGTLTLLIGVSIAAMSMKFAIRPTLPRVSRLAITTSPTTAVFLNGVDRDLVITPDGSRVVYVGNNGTELFVRPLESLETTSIFKGAPRGPFVSPDGQWIGFADGGTVLKKVAIAGGPAVTIATLGASSRGAVWMPDDTIIFAIGGARTGLQRVAATGGPTSVVTRPDVAHGEGNHAWPEVLPGGQAVLFTIYPETGIRSFDNTNAQIAVLDLKAGSKKVVVGGGTHAQYVSSGHLVYAAGNALRAVPFDPATLESHGASAAVVTEVATTGVPPTGGVDAAIAHDGALVYVRGGLGGPLGSQRPLVWLDRQGREMPIAAPLRNYLHVRISPDGGRVAVWDGNQDSDIWTLDLNRLTLTRVTFTPGTDLFPVWTPDGRRLIYSSEREGVRNLFWQAADGSGIVERLTRSPDQQNATAVTPDGGSLIFAETVPKTGEDVMQIQLGGTHTISSLVQSPFTERNGIVSPDGRWLAYEANDSGQFEIYVRPYPDTSSGHWQVSTGGGTRPLWSRNGQELFYVSLTGAIMGVGIARGSSWTATTPTMIVKEGYVTAVTAVTGRLYDVSPDGQRFLMLKPGEPNAPPPQMVVVQHFDEELKRLVPPK